MTDFDYSDEVLQEVERIFRAFANLTRLKIIRELHNGPRSVSQLVEAVGGSQANISKHLSILREEGLLDKTKQGTSSIYRIANEDVSEICERVCGYLQQRIEQRRARLDL